MGSFATGAQFFGVCVFVGAATAGAGAGEIQSRVAPSAGKVERGRDAGAGDRNFTLDAGTGKVRFGDGVKGKRPQAGDSAPHGGTAPRVRRQP